MWLEGTIPDWNAGRLIEVLDTELAKNDHWTIYDAAAGVAAQKIANGDFATNDFTGWTAGANWNASTGKAVHAAGSVATLTQGPLSVNLEFYYNIVLTISGRTAGTLTISMASTAGGPLVCSADGVYTLQILTQNVSPTLTLTPSTDFDGAVDDVSILQNVSQMKVYRCYDADIGCDFYLKVDDYHSGFATLQIWQGWNATTHAGVGLYRQVTSGTSYFRWARPSGGYKISLHDHHFIFINSDSSGYFYGRPSLYDETKNIVMIAASGPSDAGSNMLAASPNGATGGWCFLFDEAGNQTNAKPAGGSWSGTLDENKSILDIAGGYQITEETIANSTTLLVVGTMPGVCNLGDQPNGLAQGDIVTVDGVDWLAICGLLVSNYYWSLVRKD